MRKFIPLVAIVATVIGLFAYASQVRPEVVRELLIQVDVFGLTQPSRHEMERKRHINNLKITWEEKQVLLNRTVFMGASVDMVRLALGEPKKTLQKELPERGAAIYLVYYLPNDKRPTILVFVKNELVQAYKGSALDFAQ